MADTARNQPCPCGSGKKYKKCCALAAGPEALLAQALAAQQAGRLEEARALCQQLLAAHPKHADALHLAGLLAHQRGDLAAAAAWLGQAAAEAPTVAAVHHNLGVVRNAQGELEQAAACYLRALALKPDYASAHNNLGVVYKQQERLDAAIGHFQQALALNPGYADAHSNLGTCHNELGQLEQAAACYRQAIAADPNFAAAHNNLGQLHVGSGQYPQAIGCFLKALALKPAYPDASFNLSLALLVQGELETGFRHYESRYHPARGSRNTVPPKVRFPQWQGEPLAGKSLLVWKEQGFGDEVQFCRYLPLLRQMGVAKVTWVCKKPLQPLLATLPGLDSVISVGDAFGHHDYWTFPLSLPLHCRTTLATIPAFASYLYAPEPRQRHWRARLPPADRPRIGLVWKGASKHKNDRNRSLPHLSCLAPLLAVAGMHWVSLQKGQGEDEVGGHPVLPLGPNIGDFGDTAAIISHLDLLICVDTAAAHVAGALGKPVWLMLPAAPDWRWLLHRTDSPWYPRTRLFRQTSPGDWDEVVARMIQALEDWLDGA